TERLCSDRSGGRLSSPAPGVFVAKGYVGDSLGPVKNSGNWEYTLQAYTDKYWCRNHERAALVTCFAGFAKKRRGGYRLSPEGPAGDGERNALWYGSHARAPATENTPA